MGKSVIEVKEVVDNFIGQKIKFKIRKGKNRSQMSEGVLMGTYPSIFTVNVENKGLKRIMSFNYIDLMTEYVELFHYDEEETRIV